HYMIIQADDLSQQWWPLYDTQYLYPAGQRLWVVLKEGITIHNRDTRWSEAYAVDATGHLLRFRSLDGRNLEFEPAPAEVAAQAAQLLRDGVVVAQDAASLAAMQQRLPGLQAKPD